MAVVALAIVFAVVPVSAQRAYGPMPVPPFVNVDLQDIKRLDLSPLVLTVWNYISAESQVTTSQGFGLSITPHFGSRRISPVERLSVWGFAGAAVGVLGASAPTLEITHLPKQAWFALGLGVPAGVATGLVVWQGARFDHADYARRPHFTTLELTVVSVRLDFLDTPISLPDVTYAWVPALVGTWW